jgi:hypothetical protein
MKTRMAQSLVALTLCATSLLGCGERPKARDAQQSPAPTASAVATLRPDPTATPSCPPAPAVAAPATPATPSDTRAPADKPKTATKAKATAQLRVKRLVIAEGVKDREPVHPSATFRAAESDRIYAFVELENADQAESEVTVAFVPPGGGAPIGNVTLDVGPHARWRTWAYTRGARKAGEWTAVVRSPTGEVLARTPFEVTL